MKLYHHPFSSNARKAVMTAKLLGSPVELVFVNLAKGEQKTPEYLALNPNGRVPTLVDGDYALWESYAIMTYLADKSPEKAANTLYPTSARARADVHRWLFWAAHHLSPTIGTLNFENMLKKMFGQGDPDPAVVARAERDLRVLATVLDSHLSNRTWLSGEGLTLADVAVACPLMSTVPARLPVTDFANLQAWFTRVQALDAWKETNPRPMMP